MGDDLLLLRGLRHISLHPLMVRLWLVLTFGPVQCFNMFLWTAHVGSKVLLGQLTIMLDAEVSLWCEGEAGQEKWEVVERWQGHV